MVGPRGRNRGRVASAALVLPLLAGTLCAPPPDLDATPPGAVPLDIGQWTKADIDCSRRVADCVDWYRLEVPDRGTLQLDLARMEGEAPTPDFALVLGDAAATEIRSERNGGQTRLRIREKVDAGPYFVAVTTPVEGGGAMQYELRAKFARYVPPPPPPPRFRQIEAEILELHDGPGGAEAVLIDKGSRAGVAKGQRGRLLRGGGKIADIEVYEVYEEGARAVIRGSLAAPIDASTRAEIEVPR